MYEYQSYATTNGTEYIVRGATVACAYSQTRCVLNLPKAHGVFTADGRPLITESDCNKDNIAGFDYCNLLQKKCDPSIKKWESDAGKKIKNSRTLSEERAVTRGAVGRCEFAGRAVIIFESSGQVAPDYSNVTLDGIEIIEDIERDWEKVDEKDFIGYFTPKRSGIYNLGIHLSKGDVYQGAVVFVYEKAKKGLKYLGAYNFLIHKNDIRLGLFTSNITDSVDENTGDIKFEFEKEKWEIWAEMVLDKNKVYYFEIDCPGKTKISYKLVGNLEQEYYVNPSESKNKNYSETTISSFWMIDPQYEKTYSSNYIASAYQEPDRLKIIAKFDIEFVYQFAFAQVIKRALEKQNKSILSMIKNHGGTVLSFAGFVSAPWGPIFSALSILMSFYQIVH